MQRKKNFPWHTSPTSQQQANTKQDNDCHIGVDSRQVEVVRGVISGFTQQCFYIRRTKGFPAGMMGWTPLHIALNTRDLELFKRLLQTSPDTSIRSKDGLTVAASLARRTGSRQVILFVKHRMGPHWHCKCLACKSDHCAIQEHERGHGHTWILEHEGAMIGLFTFCESMRKSRVEIDFQSGIHWQMLMSHDCCVVPSCS